MEGKDKAQELMEIWLEESSTDYKSLMAYYECAIMEVETKFKVLSKNFSLGDDCNPIESIQSRLKSSRSILKKMQKKGLPLTVEAIEQNLHDIAGVRVICSTVSDGSVIVAGQICVTPTEYSYAAMSRRASSVPSERSAPIAP